MLRIYFLQQWFDLSDPVVEDALYDSVTMRRFVGIDLGVARCRMRRQYASSGICWNALRGLALYQFICQDWQMNSSDSKFSPCQPTVGLDTYWKHPIYKLGLQKTTTAAPVTLTGKW